MPRASTPTIYYKEPLYHVSSPSLRNEMVRFIELTDPLKTPSKNPNLLEIVSLAHKACEFIRVCNPFLVLNNTNYTAQKAKPTLIKNAISWELYQISKVDLRVYQAMQHKQKYYSSTLCGRIKVFFLKLFGMWNGGYTKCIQSAEDFLLYWNPVFPLKRKKNQVYELRSFWDFKVPLPKNPLFYSYNPKHYVRVDHFPRKIPRKISPLFISSSLVLR